MHVDCVPHMVDVLMQNKQQYIADHLHPNDAGHERIFQLIKNDLDAIIHT
jgi:lysophospholipase L1-like esterase